MLNRTKRWFPINGGGTTPAGTSNESETLSSLLGMLAIFVGWFFCVYLIKISCVGDLFQICIILNLDAGSYTSGMVCSWFEDEEVELNDEDDEDADEEDDEVDEEVDEDEEDDEDAEEVELNDEDDEDADEEDEVDEEVDEDEEDEEEEDDGDEEAPFLQGITDRLRRKLGLT